MFYKLRKIFNSSVYTLIKKIEILQSYYFYYIIWCIEIYFLEFKCGCRYNFTKSNQRYKDYWILVLCRSRLHAVMMIG